MVTRPDSYWKQTAERVLTCAVAHVVLAPQRERAGLLRALLSNPEHPAWEQIAALEGNNLPFWRENRPLWKTMLATARVSHLTQPPPPG